VGSTVGVSLRLPGEDSAIECEGEVVNVPDTASFGMGVRFLNMSADDRARLEAFTLEVETGR
jgi:hypothetical protein